MREIRQYGSEGGAAGQPAVPTPIGSCNLESSAGMKRFARTNLCFETNHRSRLGQHHDPKW